jgi:hypothetical protein
MKSLAAQGVPRSAKWAGASAQPLAGSRRLIRPSVDVRPSILGGQEGSTYGQNDAGDVLLVARRHRRLRITARVHDELAQTVALVRRQLLPERAARTRRTLRLILNPRHKGPCEPSRERVSIQPPGEPVPKSLNNAAALLNGLRGAIMSVPPIVCRRREATPPIW